MITVSDLARKLMAYSREMPGNGSKQIMLAFDGGVAYPFLQALDQRAYGPGGIENFLVLHPDLHSRKLVLKGNA